MFCGRLLAAGGQRLDANILIDTNMTNDDANVLWKTLYRCGGGAILIYKYILIYE